MESTTTDAYFLKFVFVREILSQDYVRPSFAKTGPHWHQKYFGKFLKSSLQVNAAQRGSADELVQHLQNVAAKAKINGDVN